MPTIRVLEKEGLIRKLVEKDSEKVKQFEADGYKATKKVFANGKTFLLMEIAKKDLIKEKNPIDKNINKVNIKNKGVIKND